MEFNDYSTRYREERDPVLKDITASINGSEKVVTLCIVIIKIFKCSFFRLFVRSFPLFSLHSFLFLSFFPLFFVTSHPLFLKPFLPPFRLSFPRLFPPSLLSVMLSFFLCSCGEMLPSVLRPPMGPVHNPTSPNGFINAVRLLQASKELANVCYLVPHN